jgi:hypothetical protein
MYFRFTALLTGLLALSFHLFGQTNSNPNSPDTLNRTPARFIAFKAGGGIPLGNYGITDQVASGNALPGFLLGAELAFISRWRHTGFGISGGYLQNRLDERSITSTAGASVSFRDASPYRNTYLMAGPYLTLPLKNVFIDFKLLGGLLVTAAPSFDGIFVRDNQTFSFSAEGQVSNTFGYNPGLNIRIATPVNLQFVAGLDYLYGKPDLSYTLTFVTNPNIPELEAARQTVSVLNLTWGVAFAF